MLAGMPVAPLACQWKPITWAELKEGPPIEFVSSVSSLHLTVYWAQALVTLMTLPQWPLQYIGAAAVHVPPLGWSALAGVDTATRIALVPVSEPDAVPFAKKVKPE